MAVIENTAAIPPVEEGFHLLEIEAIEAVEGTKYNEPDVPETRLKVQLRVRTPGVSDESFSVWMSPNLGSKATLGGIALAILGSTPQDAAFNTDVLIGRRFRQLVGHNERGYPRLVPGTSAPEKPKKGDEPPF